MEADFLLDRLDGGSNDDELELQRPPQPAAGGSALRSCHAAVSRPPIVLCLDAAMAVVTLALVAFRLDNFPFAPSWCVASLRCGRLRCADTATGRWRCSLSCWAPRCRCSSSCRALS